MKKEFSKKGFTLFEMIVVITIIWITVFTFAHMLGKQSYAYERSVTYTWEQLISKLDSTLWKSMTWLWDSDVRRNDVKNSKNELPERYLLYFEAQWLSNLNNSEVKELYIQERQSSWVSYWRTTDIFGEDLFQGQLQLREIRLKESEGSVWDVVSSLWVSFLNPTGKMEFILNESAFDETGDVVISDNSEDTINEYLSPDIDSNYSLAELSYYNEDRLELTLIIFKDKQYYIRRK